MTAARWSRLVDSLGAEHIDATVTTRTYPGGTTRYIDWLMDDGSLISVHDKWWRKNDDVWIGWQVHIENSDSTVTRTWPITKKRGDVVAFVADALPTRKVTP